MHAKRSNLDAPGVAASIFSKSAALSVLAALAWAVSPAAYGNAKDVIWRGGNGNWNDPSLWNVPEDPSLAIDPNNGVLGFNYKVSIAGNSVVKLKDNRQIDQLSISAGSSLVIENSQQLTLSGSAGPILLNEGTLQFASLGNFTDLLLSGGEISFTGGGTVTLGAHSNNRIGGQSGSERLVNVDNVIQGGGQIGLNQIALTNQSVIEANQAGTALVLDPNSVGFTNTGTLRAADGATLLLQDGTFQNSGGVVAAKSGSRVDLSGATLAGGTLTTFDTGRIRNLNTAALDGVTLSADSVFEQANNSQTKLSGSFANRGTYSMLSAGNSTDLIIVGDVVLSGGGTLDLSANFQNRLYGQAGTERLTNTDNLIRGSGQLGVNLLALTNQGTIQADQSGAPLTLDPGSGGVENAHTLKAVNGGVLQLHGGRFTNTSSGLIFADDASEVELHGAVVVGGTLATAGTGVIQNTGVAGLQDVTLAAGSKFQQLNNTRTDLAGSLSLLGVLSLESLGNQTDLVLGENTLVSGDGSISLSANFQNRIYGGDGNEHLTSNTLIRGSGQLGVNLLAITNQSVVQADRSGANLRIDPNATGFANYGTLRATQGATLELHDGLFTNSPNGKLLAEGSSSINLNGAAVSGGTLATIGSGVIRNVAASSLQNTTLTGGSRFEQPNNTALKLIGSLENQGILALLSLGNQTDLVVSGDVSLSGGGTVALSGNAQNRIYGQSGTERLVNAGNLIRGGGQIGVNLLALTNQGVIEADQPGASLTLDPSTGGFLNENVVRASQGATLNLVDGVFTNSNSGVMEAIQGSAIRLNGATVEGGTLLADATSSFVNNGNARLRNLAIATGTTITQPNNTLLNLEGTLHNSGLIQVASQGNHTDLLLGGSGDVTLLGGGVLHLTPNAQNRIYASSSGNRLVNLNHTIQGSGQIGLGQISILNQGTLEAIHPAVPLTVDTAAGFTLVNEGLARAMNGATLLIADPFLNKAITEVDSGSKIDVAAAFTQTTSGATRLRGGTLEANSFDFQGGALLGFGTVVGDVQSAAFLSPGEAIGTLNFSGNLTLAAASQLFFQLGGATRGTLYDTILAQGATLNGALLVAFANGFEELALADQTFTLLESINPLNGVFAGIADGSRLTTLDGFGSFVVNYGPNSVFLTDFQAIPEPGTVGLILIGLGVLARAHRRRT